MSPTTFKSDHPNPPGASRVDPWVDLPADPSRYIETLRALIPCDHGDVAVYACGVQHADGTVSPVVVVSNLDECHPATAGQAREIAAALLRAADAAENLSAG